MAVLVTFEKLEGNVIETRLTGSERCLPLMQKNLAEEMIFSYLANKYLYSFQMKI